MEIYLESAEGKKESDFDAKFKSKDGVIVDIEIICIVNMSISDDEAIFYKQSEVDRLTGQLVEEGIVVAAVGNKKTAR